MRIGVYLGSWPLPRLGGMGVYLQNLLAGVDQARQFDEEIVLLVDRANLESAERLDLPFEIALLDRPGWDDIPLQERRGVLHTRWLSYRDSTAAEARRVQGWSAAARAYLWGLDDAVKSADVDLLYFTIPPYLKWPRTPVVLTIHDLKHVHRPQDHEAGDLARRRRWRRAARAADVAYASYQHIRNDIVQHLGVRRERTAVLPLAPPAGLAAHAGSAAAAMSARTGDLPQRFALLPAQLWPHKNHALVILAVSHLKRDRGLEVPVICTGQTDGECAAHAVRMRRLARELNVQGLVRFVGLIERDELLDLYRRARFVIAPTLYDPGSFPVLEALALGRPLIASNVTSIPEAVGDAGLLFNPGSVDELVVAMERLWRDDALCADLSQRGPSRIPNRTWSDVGRDWLDLCHRAHAAHYGRELPGVRGAA